MTSNERASNRAAESPRWLRDKFEYRRANSAGRERFDPKAVLVGVAEGYRDETLFRYACYLRNANVPQDLAQGLVLQAADACDPSFSDDEALAKVASAYDRYQPGTPSRTYGTDTTDATDTGHQLRELSEAPPFPVEALPEPCRRLVEEAAASIVCPPEFIAVPLLATLGSAIGMSRVVRLKQGWTESAAIYAAIVALPGTKKTPAFKEAARPAHEKQAEYRQEYRETKKAYEDQKVERRGEAEEDGNSDQETPPKPTLKRTVVEDTTVEALAVVLEDNPRGVLLARDELSAFVRGMDQYKNHRGSDRQFYLSAWSNSAVSVDRKNLDEPIFLARPFVGVVGSIQPGVLPELIANRQGREGDGFLDRFLFSYPEPMLSRWSDEEISLEAVLAVQWLYDRLREDLPLEHNDNGDPRPREVVLSGEALARFREEVDALREEMEEPDFSNVLRGPWSKLEAYLARLSLVLAMARIVRGPARAERVELEDVERATSLVEYFKAHARKAYLQLYGESREDRLLADLTKILKENKGKWEDDPKKGWEDPASKLYEALKERGFDALPPRADELSKEILALASHVPVLRAQRGKRGNERVLRIWLAEPPAPPVSVVSVMTVAPRSCLYPSRVITRRMPSDCSETSTLAPTSRKERNRVKTDETPGGISRAIEELSPQQEGAIVALLSDPGLTGAAKAAGVGKATLWRWMQQPAFREAYRRARREAVEQARARLRQASGEAVEALRDVMNDQEAPHASRVSAARTVLDMAMQATSEEEIEKRLAALEARAMRKGA